MTEAQNKRLQELQTKQNRTETEDGILAALIDLDTKLKLGEGVPLEIIERAQKTVLEAESRLVSLPPLTSEQKREYYSKHY